MTCLHHLGRGRLNAGEAKDSSLERNRVFQRMQDQVGEEEESMSTAAIWL